MGEDFRDALGKLQCRPLLVVISALGVRRDTEAIAALSLKLTETDPDVAQAAARALGKIGTTAAAQRIQAALNVPLAGNQVAFCESLFRCAEALSIQGQRAEATAIYDRLRGLTEPHQVRAGGLRGAILTRGKEGWPLLVDALRGDDWVFVAAAARAAIEIKDAGLTRVLTAELPKLKADTQVLLTQVLGRRGDSDALPALSAAAQSGEKRVRVAAIRALPEIGHASASPTLVALLGDAERDIAQTAQESLAALPGPQVDAVVMMLLSSTDSARRIAAIDLIARRRMTSAIPALAKLAGDVDEKVRPAALRRLGEMAGPDDLPALLDLLANSKSAQDLDAAEQALSSLCSKAGEPDVSAGKLIALLPKLQPAQKCTGLRVLAATGGNVALRAVRAAVDDSNAEVHAAAIRALGGWKTVDAAPDLLALAQSATNPIDKMLCLRSYLGLVSQSELPADRRLAMCKQAIGSVQNDDGKKLLLGTLGGIQTPAALEAIAPYVNDEGVKAEASTAALGIAERLLKGKEAARLAPRLVETLQKLAQANANTDLGKRANALLQQAQSKAAQK